VHGFALLSRIRVVERENRKQHHDLPSVERRKHGLGDCIRAILTAEFHRFDAAGVSLVYCALDPLRGIRGRRVIMLVGEPVEHHRRRKKHWVGFALPWPMISGAVPWHGWNTACLSPISADGAMPRPPINPAARSERMSPKMFSITMTSKSHGRRTISAAQA